MEEQKSISDKQVVIAKKQTEIMNQQNKISLFEKRFEFLVEIKMILNLAIFSDDIQCGSSASNYVELLRGSEFFNCCDYQFEKRIEILEEKTNLLFDKVDFECVKHALEQNYNFIRIFNSKELEEQLDYRFECPRKEDFKYLDIEAQIKKIEAQTKL